MSDLRDRIDRELAVMAACVVGACAEISDEQVATGLELEFERLKLTLEEVT